jgi:hypothetical protein
MPLIRANSSGTPQPSLMEYHMTVRAKFRCLEVAERYDDTFRVELKPVWRNSGGNAEENKKFWTATPSGSCELWFKAKPDFKPKSYYYIDMTPSQTDSGWTVSAANYSPSYVEVALGFWAYNQKVQPSTPGLSNGTLKLGLDRSHAAAVIEAFGIPNNTGVWDVSFSLAEDGED